MRGMPEHRRSDLPPPIATQVNEFISACLYPEHRAVLLAPSFERGIDLAGEDCRVQIVAKILTLPTWVTLESARAVTARRRRVDRNANNPVQMTGRGVRSDDYCTTYILDKASSCRTWRRNRTSCRWWVARQPAVPVRGICSRPDPESLNGAHLRGLAPDREAKDSPGR